MNSVCFLKVSSLFLALSTHRSRIYINIYAIIIDKPTLLAYENHLPVFKRLLVQEPQHSRFMKLVADAPTTTLQRLKGITTGSLPTFIDIGSNFATAEINEDNIIDQVSNRKRWLSNPSIQ